VFQWLRNLLKPKQQTFTRVYCPQCNNELVTDEATTFKHTPEGFVQYDCGKCHAQHVWDFDAPVPLLLRRLN